MAGNMDERVVSMEFDNKNFEKNVKHSMKTIDDLKESLNFDKTGESFDEFTEKCKKFGKDNVFKNVDDSVLSLRKGIGLLGDSAGGLFKQFAEITKITALFDAATAAINRLKAAVKSFTIAPIMQGYSKYETKIGSIKTIANATGMAAEKVNESLDRLNWFTDETSASFESMVQNIGKFTSVGRGLEESITAMQGIAAWGYHSGASVAEQTRAMYNLSQALGTGSVKLIDWKSIENAGMATKEFKEQAIAAAEAAGTLKRKGDKLFAGKDEVTVENFNSTLAKGWFSSEVLMDVLTEYGSFADKVKKYMDEHPDLDLTSHAMTAMDVDRLTDKAKNLIGIAGITADEVNEELGRIGELEKPEAQLKQLEKYTADLETKVLDKLTSNSKKSRAEIEADLKALTKLGDNSEQEDLMERLVKQSKKSRAEIDKSVKAYTSTKDEKKKKEQVKKFAKLIGVEESQAEGYLAKLSLIDAKSIAERKKQIEKFAKDVGISVEEATRYIKALRDGEESLGEKAFKSSQQAKSFSEAIDATKDAVSTGWMKTFQYIFGGLDKSIELWSDVTEILWELFAAGASFRNNAFMHWAEQFNGWADLWNADEEAGPLGALRNIANTIIELKNLLGSSFRNVFFSGLESAIGGAITTWDRVNGIKNGLKTDDQIRNWREGQYMGYQLKQATSGIREFTAKINEFFTNQSNLEKIGNIFTAIANAVRFAVSVVSSFFSAITNFVTKTGIFQDILNVLSKVATKITEVFQKLEDSGFIKKLFGGISDTFVWFYNLIKGWITQIKDFFNETGIGQAIRDWFNGIIEWFTGSEKDVDENGKKTESGFFRAFGWLKDVKAWFEKINLKDILYDIKLVIDNFTTIWNTFIQALNGTQVSKDQFKQGGVSDKLAGILEAVSNFGTKLAGVWGFVKGVFDSVVTWLETTGILPAIRNFWDGLKTFFGNLGLVWEALTKGKVADPKALDEKQKKLVEGVLNFVKKIQKAFAKVKGWFTTAWNWIKEKWALLVGWLESSGILPTIRNAWEKIKMFFGNIGLVWRTFIQGVNGTKVTKDQLKQGGISEGLADFLEGISNLGIKVREIIGKIKGAWDKVKNWLETSGILPTLRSWWAGITEWFEGVKKDIEENGVFKGVSDFFTNLWEKVTGLFGGGEQSGSDKDATVKLPNVTTKTAGGEVNTKETDKKKGIFQKIGDAFTDKDGNFDLIKGLTTGIVKLFELIGDIDWASISSNVFGVMVKVINGLDDAVGKVHIDNIIKLIHKIIGAFTGVMIFKGFTDLLGTIRAIAKKGNDKTTLERFTEFLSALGTALLQIGIAVLLIAGSMWILSKIDKNRFDAVKEMMLGIGIFIIGFVAIAALLNAFLPHAEGMPVIFKSIGQMFLNIGIALVLMVAGIWMVTKLLEDDGSIGDKMKTALIVIGGILIFMTVLMIAVGQLTKKSGTLNVAVSIATFIGMAILIVAVTACILLLQHVPWDVALINAGILSGVLILLAVAMRIMNKIEIKAKTLGVMILMAVILGIVAAALVLLKDTDPTQCLKIVGIILLALVGLVAVFALMSVLNPLAVIKGATAIAAGLAILAAGLAAVALIASAAAPAVVNALVNVMSSMATASVSAGIVDIEQIKEVLGLLPIIVSAFATCGAAKPEPAKMVANAAWDVFGYLATASTSATAVDEKQFHKIFGKDGKGGLLNIIQTALSGITDTGDNAVLLGSNVEKLSESFKLVGMAGLQLNQSLSDYGDQTYTQGIENVKSRLTDIQTIVDIATTMGTSATGEKVDLTKFSEGIANVGAALQLYNEALSTFETGGNNNLDAINETDVAPLSTENISAALQSVMSALSGVTFDQTQIGAIEGWAGLSGGESGTLFALGLTNIANAMGTFSNAATDFNNDNVDKAINSLGTLAEIKNKVENPSDYNGMIDDITSWGDSGDSSTKGTFANAISSMGTAMAAFGQSVKDIPSDAVTNATTALETLSTIYDKLNGKENMMSSITKVTSNWFGQSSETTTFDTKTASDVLGDFGLGIEHLGSALATFSKYITEPDYKYDETKVETAVSILESMVKINEKLVGLEGHQDIFDKVFFGENGLKKFGDNLSGLGARLTTFARELNGTEESGSFDLDVNGDRWKSISGVLTYLVDLQTQLYTLASYTEELDETGKVISSSNTSGYTLNNLADNIKNIMDAIVDFNEKMQTIHTVQNSGTVDEDKYRLGEWSSENYKNIMSFLNDMKQFALDIKSGNLSKSDIELIGTFGDNIGDLFGRLNNRDGGFNAIGTDGVSNLVEFTKKLSSENGFDSGAFSTFISNLRTLAEAAGVLHSQEVDWNDIDNMATLAERIMSITSTGFTTEAFNTSGIRFATELVSGFVNYLTQAAGSAEGNDQTIMGAIAAMLESIDFQDKGKTAGEQYATGFNEGLNSIDSGKLTPVINMDNTGNVTGGTGIVAVLSAMKYATSTDIAGLGARIEAINSHFANPIKVNDAHTDIVNAIAITNEKLDNLKSIKTDVESLKKDVKNLEVYIYPKQFVGAIGPYINSYLGAQANNEP